MKQYYYIINGIEAEVPCSEAELAAYFFQGIITADTQITVAGSEQWQPYATLFNIPIVPNLKPPVHKRSKFIPYMVFAICIIACFSGYMIWILGHDGRVRSDDFASYLLGRPTCAEDIFSRDFDAVELRTVYHNRRNYILSNSFREHADEVAKAISTLNEYYNTALAELGLPPIN